ncbi:branched-chain amino acid ABC transporter permease, partial [Brevibacillus porteri]
MSLTNVQMKLSQRDEDSFIKGVKDCIPTLLGYLSIGLAAGVVQKT